MFTIKAAPIFEVGSFWTFAAKHKGEITRLQFEFVVPNMFGGSDSIIDELREFREKEKARRVMVELKSKDGLDTDTERTREAVNYVSKAGGKIRARARKKQTCSSTNKAKRGSIPEDGGSTERTFDRIAKFTRHILGRE